MYIWIESANLIIPFSAIDHIRAGGGDGQFPEIEIISLTKRVTHFEVDRVDYALSRIAGAMQSNSPVRFKPTEIITEAPPVPVSTELLER